MPAYCRRFNRYHRSFTADSPLFQPPLCRFFAAKWYKSTPFQPRFNPVSTPPVCASFVLLFRFVSAKPSNLSPLRCRFRPFRGCILPSSLKGVYLYHYAANTPLNAHQRLLVEPYAPAGVYRWPFGPRSCRRDSYPGPAPVHPLPPYCRRTWSDLLILCKPWRHVYLYLYPALMGTHRLFRGPKSHVLKIEPPPSLSGSRQRRFISNRGKYTPTRRKANSGPVQAPRKASSTARKEAGSFQEVNVPFTGQKRDGFTPPPACPNMYTI